VHTGCLMGKPEGKKPLGRPKHIPSQEGICSVGSLVRLG